MIKCNNLSFGYTKQQLILKNISLTISDHEKIGILGESGSGKSTLASLMLGQLKPSQGTIKLNSTSILPILQHAFDSFNPQWTIKQSLIEALYYYRKISDEHTQYQLMQEFLQQFNLDEALIYHYPREVSGGQLQRFNIMRTLMAQPEILICDEMTSSLDVLAEQRVLDILKQYDLTQFKNVFIISHDLSVLQRIVDRIIVLKDGEIVDDFSLKALFDEDRHPYTQELIASFE